MIHDQFIKTFSADVSTPPIIIDENGCLELLTQITGKHLISLDECRGGEFSFISLYEIPEDKKLFDITTVRNCIRDISLKPYAGKQIYILRSIDRWTPEAMNALLKILEECPTYASIILVVDDSEGLLETIHSRCMNLYQSSDIWEISDELRQYFDEYVFTHLEREWDRFFQSDDRCYFCIGHF